MAAIYTSITLSYLAKARTLARSVKQHSPYARFYLVLSEPAPASLLEGVQSKKEPFDEILTLGDLPIPNARSWVFRHNIVEACTGVKAPALNYLLNDRGEEAVIYLDPDIVVFSDIRPIFDRLNENSIVITPHCPVAEHDHDCIVFNEVSSLAHGVYNLGFIAVSSSKEGKRFAEWWTTRLLRFCHDNVPSGLFTDQKWIDLVPAQFDGVDILRDGQFNAASWNVTTRHISGTSPDKVLVDNKPLCFYHFSGVNSGVPERMYEKFGLSNETIRNLIAWYRSECERNGENQCRGSQWHFDHYDDGRSVTRAQRLYYRDHPQLWEQFSDPFDSTEHGYRTWLAEHGPGLDAIEESYGESPEALRSAAHRLKAIENTRAYRIYTWVRACIPQALLSLVR